MSLTPTTLTPTADPAVFLVPEDYQAGTLAVLVAGIAQQPGVVYDAAGNGNRTVTFAVAPSGWVAGTWVTVAGLGAGTYLTTALLQAKLGGEARYLELTDDDGDGTPDPIVEQLLLSEVDTVVDAYARRGGYAVPLGPTDIAPILPLLLSIATFSAKTRGDRIASDDDRKAYQDAMTQLHEIAIGTFKLPSFGATQPIGSLRFSSSGDPRGGPLFDRDRLKGYG